MQDVRDEVPEERTTVVRYGSLWGISKMQQSSTPTPVGSSTGGESRPHDGRRLGSAAHRVIGSLLDAGVRAPAPEDIHRFVAVEPVLREPHVYRLAARQRLATAVAVYFRFLLPGPEWSFVGAEIRVPGAALDLLFEDRTGRLRADELKTGGAPDLARTSQLRRQLEGQLAGGLEAFGDRFMGVRALFLGAPRRSFTLEVDGGRAPVDVRER
jgi:hypothetical protein